MWMYAYVVNIVVYAMKWCYDAAAGNASGTDAVQGEVDKSHVIDVNDADTVADLMLAGGRGSRESR